MSSSASVAQSAPPPPQSKMDPVLLNAMRYSINEKEYHMLHQYLLNRSPRSLQKRAPQPAIYEASFKSRDDYNAAAVRASLRLFVASQAGLKLWDGIKLAIARLRKTAEA